MLRMLVWGYQGANFLICGLEVDVCLISRLIQLFIKNFLFHDCFQNERLLGSWVLDRWGFLALVLHLTWLWIRVDKKCKPAPSRSWRNCWPPVGYRAPVSLFVHSSQHWAVLLPFTRPSKMASSGKSEQSAAVCPLPQPCSCRREERRHSLLQLGPLLEQQSIWARVWKEAGGEEDKAWSA